MLLFLNETYEMIMLGEISEREHPYMVACPPRQLPYLCESLIYQDFIFSDIRHKFSSIPENN